MSAATTATSQTHWRHGLAAEELEQLLAVSGARGLLSVIANWGLIAVSFFVVAIARGPIALAIAILLALFVIGGRQLGLAVLMHEAAHRILLRNRRGNDWVGNWLCAYPIWSDLHSYRAYHLQHHAKNWTDEDPDLGLATPFPITRVSLRRKVWRDLSGQVAWKRVKAILRRDLAGASGSKSARIQAKGLSFGKTAGDGAAGWHNLIGVVVTNAVLLGLLALLGRPELYLLWVAAWFTTYSLVTRIRSIAEHNMVDDPADELRNTRTTLASWWERLLLAPNRVNYHLEHHLLPNVPFYHLPRMHRLLRERGGLDGALVSRGYASILREAASKAA